jgi:hypothetical protein
MNSPSTCDEMSHRTQRPQHNALILTRTKPLIDCDDSACSFHVRNPNCALLLLPFHNEHKASESSKAYFLTEKYNTLDRKAILSSASLVQVYWTRERRSEFISIFSLSRSLILCEDTPDVSADQGMFKTIECHGSKWKGAMR